MVPPPIFRQELSRALPSLCSAKESCRTQDTTKSVVLQPLCACVIGLGLNVSLSGWPSQLRLRDGRHRIFLSLTSPFYGRLSRNMSKIHQNDILLRPSREVAVCYCVILTQRHLQSFRPVSPCGVWVADAKVARKVYRFVLAMYVRSSCTLRVQLRQQDSNLWQPD